MFSLEYDFNLRHRASADALRLLTGSQACDSCGRFSEPRTGRNRKYHEALQASETTIFLTDGVTRLEPAILSMLKIISS